MLNLAKTARLVPVVLASLILWVSFASGQPAAAGAGELTKPPRVTAGLYAGLGFGTEGLGANGGLNFGYGKYSGTLCGTLDANLPDSWGEPSRKFSDIGLIFGYSPHPIIRIGAGVAWVEIREDHVSGWWGGWSEYSNTVGIPVGVQLSPLKSRYVGLGITAHVNFNTERVFGNLTAGIELGKLK